MLYFLVLFMSFKQWGGSAAIKTCSFLQALKQNKIFLTNKKWSWTTRQILIGCQSCHFWLASHPTWMKWTLNFRERITSSVISTKTSKDFRESCHCLKHKGKEKTHFDRFNEFCTTIAEEVNLDFPKKIIHDLKKHFFGDFWILTELSGILQFQSVWL